MTASLSPARAEGPGARLGRSLGALTAVGRNVDIARLEVGWTTSVAADWTYTVAVLVAAYQAGGAVAVGVVGFARMVVATVTAPLVSGLVGHVDPRVLLRASAVVRLVAVGLGAVAVALGAPVVILLAAIAVEAGAFATIRPIQTAMLPGLARSPAELVAANVASSTGESVGTFVGPALGGFAVAAGGIGAASAIAAALLAVDLLAILPIAMTELPGTRPSGGGVAAAGRTTLERLVRGARFVRSRPSVAALVLAFGAQVVVRGVLNVLLVVASLRLLGLGESGVGLLNSAIGLGGFAGALGSMALVGRPRLAGAFALALVGWGLPIAFVGLVPQGPVALAAMVFLGASNATLDIAGFTLLQRLCPNDARGPVLGMLEGVVGLGFALGSVLGPLLVAALGVSAALLVDGAILPVVALLAWRSLAVADDRAVVPAHELALLLGLPFFAPLPLTVLEQLAGRMRPVTFEPGDALMVQGEPGDTFYVIEAGGVEILRDGEAVAAVGPAAAVGEIALLRHVPRTATVRAVGPTRAFALAGSDFVAAVCATPQGLTAADALVSARAPTAPEPR